MLKAVCFRLVAVRCVYRVLCVLTSAFGGVRMRGVCGLGLRAEFDQGDCAYMGYRAVKVKVPRGSPPTSRTRGHVALPTLPRLQKRPHVQLNTKILNTNPMEGRRCCTFSLIESSRFEKLRWEGEGSNLRV